MEGKDGCREPGAGHREAAEDEEQEKGGRGMQQDVEQMVTEGRVAPEPVLHPKDTVHQRIVLLGGTRLDPGTEQTREGMEFRSGKMSLIIPDRLAVPGGSVGQQRRDHQ